MRKLALLSLALAAGSVLAVATTAALGQDDPVETVPAPTETPTTRDSEEPDAEEFGRDFEDRADPQPRAPGDETPQLEPMAPPAAPTAAPRTQALPRTGADERVLVAAAFWLLLGGVTLRRVTA